MNLPEGLLKEALQITRIKTKTALIIQALDELVRKNKVAEIKQFKGRIDLDIDLSVLRDR